MNTFKISTIRWKEPAAVILSQKSVIRLLLWCTRAYLFLPAKGRVGFFLLETTILRFFASDRINLQSVYENTTEGYLQDFLSRYEVMWQKPRSLHTRWLMVILNALLFWEENSDH